MSETYKVVYQIGGKQPTHGRLCITRIIEAPSIHPILTFADRMDVKIVSVVPTGDEPEMCLGEVVPDPLPDKLVNLWKNGKRKTDPDLSGLTCFIAADACNSKYFTCRDDQVLFAWDDDFGALPSKNRSVNHYAAAVCEVFWRRQYAEREKLNDMAACDQAEKYMLAARAFGDLHG